MLPGLGWQLVTDVSEQHRPHLQGSSRPLSFEDGTDRFYRNSVTNYQPTPRDIPEGRRPTRLHRGSLKPFIIYIYFKMHSETRKKDAKLGARVRKWEYEPRLTTGNCERTFMVTYCWRLDWEWRIKKNTYVIWCIYRNLCNVNNVAVDSDMLELSAAHISVASSYSGGLLLHWS
jgi:hypothetical protein